MSANAIDTKGKYVSSVEVANGTITVVYGQDANAKINGQTLAIQPFVTNDDSITWLCGNSTANFATGTAAMNGSSSAANGTNLESKYLPSACR